MERSSNLSIRRTEPAASPAQSETASSPTPLVFGTKAWGEEYCRQVNAAQLKRKAEIEALEAAPEYKAEKARRAAAAADFHKGLSAA